MEGIATLTMLMSTSCMNAALSTTARAIQRRGSVAAAARQQLRLGEDGGGERQQLAVEGEGALGDLAQVLLDGAAAGPRGQRPGDREEGGQQLAQHGAEQVELVVEVQVQGALGAAGGAADRLGGGPGEALVEQHPPGGGDEVQLPAE